MSSGWTKSYRNKGFGVNKKRIKSICLHVASDSSHKVYIHVYCDNYNKLMIVAKKDTLNGYNIMFDKDILKRNIYLNDHYSQNLINEKFKMLSDIYPMNSEATLMNKLIIIHMHQTDILDYHRKVADEVYESIEDIKCQISMQTPHEYMPYKLLKKTGFKYAISDTVAYRSELLELFDYEMCFIKNNIS